MRGCAKSFPKSREILSRAGAKNRAEKWTGKVSETLPSRGDWTGWKGMKNSPTDRKPTGLHHLLKTGKASEVSPKLYFYS